RMPLMMYDISVAFGASNLVSFTPARLVLYVPLIAGSTKYTGRPVSSTRYFSALPPEGSWRCHTKYDLVSPLACDAGTLSWLCSWETSARSFGCTEPELNPLGSVLPTGTYTDPALLSLSRIGPSISAEAS